MKKLKKTTFLLLILIITLNLSACTHKPTEPEKKETSDETKNMVQNYIKENISELSPDKEVLGGKFYVTQVEFKDDNTVIIYYEDGHIALQAQANFKLTGDGVQIDNFKLIEDEDNIVITNEHLRCNHHDDCIPLPGCHARECINKRHQESYEQPDACTMMYDNCAAYENDDCICQQGTCFNENLMNPECNQ